MKKELPRQIAERILEMPEYRQGVNKVKLTLKDGRTYTDVYVAWGSEVVKVGKYKTIPFDPSEVIEVQNDI
jgi:hypothetical protein